MNVIVFGDSICFGEKVAPHHGWVTRLAASVEKKFSDAFLVMNHSVSGDTTRLALERMPAAVQKYGVSLLVVQFGMNDCNCWDTDKGIPRVSEEAFSANLREIVARGFHFGAAHVLLHTNHPSLRVWTPLATGRPYEEGNRRYNEIIRTVAAGLENVTLVDMEYVFRAAGRELSELLLDDEIHLSRAGHDVYFDAVAPVLLNRLASIQST